MNSLDKRAGCITGLVLDVDAVVIDRARCTCGVSDVLSANLFGLRVSSVTPCCFVSPTATRTQTQTSIVVSPSLSDPKATALEGASRRYTGWPLRQAETVAALQCICTSACAEVVAIPSSCLARGQPSHFGRVECHRHGTRYTAHWAGQAGSVYAPSMRTVGGGLSQTAPCRPDLTDGHCASQAASGAKPTVRIPFDPVHDMDLLQSPHAEHSRPQMIFEETWQRTLVASCSKHTLVPPSDGIGEKRPESALG